MNTDHESRLVAERKRILLIEDEPGVSMMMVHVLTRAGCQVAMAWDVGKGMALARSGDFDLITLDVDMLDEDGFSRDTPHVAIESESRGNSSPTAK